MRLHALALWSRLPLLGLVLATLLLPAQARAQCPRWLEGQGVPGMNNEVHATLVFDDGGGPALYIGGTFTIAGPISASRVVKWDGTHFSPLGAGLPSQVDALGVFNNQLIAGTPAGVFRWDGSTWTLMGSPSLWAISFAVYNGELYAGLQASGSGGLLRWDGSAWQTVGGGLLLPASIPSVKALAVFNNELYAVGTFTGSPTVTSNNIIRWNGSAFSTVGPASGLNSFGGTSLALFNGGLVVGGFFTSAGGQATGGAARWDGAAWSAMSLPSSAIYSLTIHQGELYAGGEFTLPGGGGFNGAARWTGSAWTDAGATFTVARVLSINSFAGDLVAAGLPIAVNGLTVNFICRRSAGVWTGFSRGLDSAVSTEAVYDGRLYIGGTFSTVDGQVARGVGAWSGTAWDSLGGGLSTINFNSVRAMTVFNDELYIGGHFSDVSGVAAAQVARWNGSAWSNAGTGFPAATVNALTIHDGAVVASADLGATQRVYSLSGGAWQPLGPPLTGTIYALASYDGSLYVGGANLSADNGVTGGSLFRLDGASWTRITGAFGIGIRTLAVFGNDLIVGGNFQSLSGVGVLNIARYDGAAIHPMGAGLNVSTGAIPVTALGEYNGGLVAHGNFTVSGVAPMSRVAIWNGTAWQGFGSGITGGGGEMGAVASFLGELYVGGNFSAAGGEVNAFIAHWGSLEPCISSDPTPVETCLGGPAEFTVLATGLPPLHYQWRQDGLPVGPDAPTITLTPATMAQAGSYDCIVSNSVDSVTSAPATLHVCAADFNCDGFINPDDLSDFITCFFLNVQFPGSCAGADFNADAFVNPDDLSDFITTFFLAVQFGC